MKKIKFKIPVLYFRECVGMYPDDISENEAINVVIDEYNKAHKNSKAYKQLITGQIINFDTSENSAKVIK